MSPPFSELKNKPSKKKKHLKQAASKACRGVFDEINKCNTKYRSKSLENIEWNGIDYHIIKQALPDYGISCCMRYVRYVVTSSICDRETILSLH
jgi:hypothetical protein